MLTGLAMAGLAAAAAYARGRAVVSRHAVDYASHWRDLVTDVPEDAIH